MHPILPFSTAIRVFYMFINLGPATVLPKYLTTWILRPNIGNCFVKLLEITTISAVMQRTFEKHKSYSICYSE